jgi:hypothetical protein
MFFGRSGLSGLGWSPSPALPTVQKQRTSGPCFNLSSRGPASHRCADIAPRLCEPGKSVRPKGPTFRKLKLTPHKSPTRRQRRIQHHSCTLALRSPVQSSSLAHPVPSLIHQPMCPGATGARSHLSSRSFSHSHRPHRPGEPPSHFLALRSSDSAKVAGRSIFRTRLLSPFGGSKRN